MRIFHPFLKHINTLSNKLTNRRKKNCKERFGIFILKYLFFVTMQPNMSYFLSEDWFYTVKSSTDMEFSGMLKIVNKFMEMNPQL